MKLKSYYILIKPGIVRANVMTAAAGFLFAARGDFEWSTLAALLVGTALVIACGCVLNNIMDVRIDKKMKRTRKRPLVTGAISIATARKFAYALGVIGLVMLAVFTNWLTVIIGILAVIFYVYIYGWSKRHTNFATEIGTIPGAASIVAGYTAATNQFDATAICLFLILATWQMAHFLSIALFRAEEYAAAKVSVLPLRKGAEKTQKRAMLYMFFYIISIILFAIYGHAGFLYISILVGVGMYWLYAALNTYQQIEPEAWGRKMFGYSLIVLLLFCLLISLESFVA